MRQISIARTLHRRFDFSEFLTPSKDQDEEAKSNQAKAKASAAAQESDFEYDGIHGIFKQTQDATTVATNQLATASANIGVAGGGVLANMAYQLLNVTQRGIKFIGGGTVNGLEKVQNKHKSWTTTTKDYLSNTGNYIVGQLEKFSGILGDVAKMSGEEEVVTEHHHRHRHVPEIQSELTVDHGSELQQEHKRINKKKKATTTDGKKKKKKGTNSNRNGDKKKKKKKVPKEEVKDGEKKKKKKKRTEKVVDENLIFDE